MIPGLPNWLSGYGQQPPDAWQQLNAWLWARHMLKHAVPKDIFDKDDDVVSDTVKLVDVAIRDCVRRLHAALLDQGMPKDVTFDPTNQPGQVVRRKRCPKCGHRYNLSTCPCCQQHPLGVR